MKILRTFLVAIAALLALAACPLDSPRATACDSEGSHMYSSKHGEFVCRGGIWVEV